MQDFHRWRYDEFKQVGKDYSNPEEVALYDASHAEFRDLEKESLGVLERLGIQPDDTVIDFGAGTGVFARQASKRCAKVYAVDVSPAMLTYAEKQAMLAGVSNIEFHHGGFLTYDHASAEVDAIVTTFAFHHLPDFWKGIALSRLHKMLKPGGQLYIADVILQETKPLDDIEQFIQKQATAGGDFLRDDAEVHFREEFSTYEWIMDGLLERAGFSIQRKEFPEPVLGVYVSTRI